MNKIFLIGNLTGDPELRTTPNGITVCTMNLAVNRRFSGNREERQTDFYRVTAWRQLGETCSRFLSKGKKIAVVGEFVPRTYEGKDGATRVSLEVTAEEIEFLSPRDAAVRVIRSRDINPTSRATTEIIRLRIINPHRTAAISPLPVKTVGRTGGGSSLRVTVSRQILLIPQTAPAVQLMALLRFPIRIYRFNFAKGVNFNGRPQNEAPSQEGQAQSLSVLR